MNTYNYVSDVLYYVYYEVNNAIFISKNQCN